MVHVQYTDRDREILRRTNRTTYPLPPKKNLLCAPQICIAYADRFALVDTAGMQYKDSQGYRDMNLPHQLHDLGYNAQRYGSAHLNTR